MGKFGLIFFLLVLVTGCAIRVSNERANENMSTPNLRPSLTPSLIPPSSTPTSTAWPSATATAAPTFPATPMPTPTATAVPAEVVGNPRICALREPVAGDGAYCGLADLFDFPLEPPDAGNNARGGTDFGIYRSRYGKYHAGEDWRTSRGRSSLGAPVHSIGHGRVTYAEPLGWGRDQGVIIIRHNFSDGRALLSFYGHLDPESFKVTAGDCVRRGELIGKIGKPKTSPHLHFEIRTHMPLETATGYWPEDPTLAGWKPPSATIWNSRMAVSPGVLWSQPFAAEGVKGVGVAGEGLFIVHEGDTIAGLETSSGDERWRLVVAEDVEQVLWNSADQQIYSANQFGEVAAFALPDGGGAPLSLWEVDLDMVGIPQLLPLPGGGLLLASWGKMGALSPEGELLWQLDQGLRIHDWTISGEELIIATTGSDSMLWLATTEGIKQWDRPGYGQLSVAGDNVLLYDGHGLYRLDLGEQSAAPLLALSRGNLREGDVLALPDGGAIITHADTFDRRLMAIDDRGNVLWERSIADYVAGEADLFSGPDQLFLLLQKSSGSGHEYSLFGLEADNALLTHLFTGGTRNSQLDQTNLVGLGRGRILINIDGRSLSVIDTRQAEQIVTAVRSSSR